MSFAPNSFPIADLLPELCARLAAMPRLVVEAPPGAGKTTQVPLALLAADWLDGRKIVMLEPRRIAARAAAEFMAAQLGERVGETVGYRIRFDSKVSARTRIEVVTEGILTRLIQGDPELRDIGAVLFDEFHERHLSGDLGAALALEIQGSLRPDLRLVLMSATLDGERVARWFDAPRLVSAGRSFPVRVEYAAAKANEDAVPHLRRVVEQALRDNDGDVLVFLPGRREIERALRALTTLGEALSPRIVVLPLHGELSVSEQHAALASALEGTRRVVLATNVAESSVTLPGIRSVVDSGLAREPYYDPNSGFTRLETVNIAQASADQRAGRAGRVAAGVAYRLWPQSRRLQASRNAEIAQTELSSLALELAAWGSSELRWLDAPPPGALASARDLLFQLGALTSAQADARLSDSGRAMLASGATPRLAAAVLRAPVAAQALACDLIALIDARNPLRSESARSDDFRLRYHALRALRDRGAQAARAAAADTALLASIEQAAQAWRRRFGVRAVDASSEVTTTTLGDLLAHAFPDRLARQDASNPLRYTLANGRGATLHAHSALIGERWLVVVDQRFDERDSLILCAAPFDPAVLEREFAERLQRQRGVRWNRDSRGVEAFEELRFGEIVLERRSLPARPADALPLLLAAVRDSGLERLPWSDAALSLRARVALLREACPELALPDLSDAALLDTLEDWLAPELSAATRLDALTAQQLSEALANRLDYAQRRALDEHAPANWRVPSGNERSVHYVSGQAPVLAVKLQELFGLADTPRIAKGRVGVTLHLLSPAQRPIQVTQDLRSFWQRTYPEVKKELKGRYPKHPWPDDPWTALPTARAKPRGR